ncbi:MAG: hypothetical protein ACKVJG_16030 [Candidatus Latescibacterota bacterium]
MSHPVANTLALALILMPAFGPNLRRDTGRDLAALRQSECEYRGITATYDELTRAYILATYSQGHLLRWQAQPSPQNPDSETLVTAIFRVETALADDERAFIRSLRQEAPPHVGITWRYSTLAATRIAPANDYARDALETFTHTVNGFIARMVVATSNIELTEAPFLNPAAGLRVDKGTALLVEDRRRDWVLVRQPSTTLRGWVDSTFLESVE